MTLFSKKKKKTKKTNPVPFFPTPKESLRVTQLFKIHITCVPQAISQGGKYKLSEDKGAFFLEIHKTDTSDSGLYTCTITNSAGSVSSSCKLTIKGKLAFILTNSFQKTLLRRHF